jgi:DNA-binding transcriptional MerR regulator
MTRPDQETLYISISTAVRQSGLSYQMIKECVQRRLVSERLSHTDLVELRRIRRLQELGVNMPGIEVILHMRRRMEALQAQLALIERRWASSGGPTPEEAHGPTSLAIWQRLLALELDDK